MKILEQPILPSGIPESSQWLAGQGAGSWFWIRQTHSENEFQIKRFSPTGNLECDRVFICNQKGFQISESYQFTYLSHCSLCTIIQNEVEFTFSFVSQ